MIPLPVMGLSKRGTSYSPHRCGTQPVATTAGICPVYREIERNAKPDGRYRPWWAHNQALLRRHRPKKEKIRAGQPLRTLVREKLTEKWSPQQIARYLAREHAHDAAMRACPETIYRALFAGLLGRRDAKLRTGRTRRKRQRRGVPTLKKIKNMTLIHERPSEVNNSALPGRWEGALIIGRGQGSTIGTRAVRHPGSSTTTAFDGMTTVSSPSWCTDLVVT